MPTALHSSGVASFLGLKSTVTIWSEPTALSTHLDSILFKRPNADQEELVKISKLLRTHYNERYSVAEDSEIKVLVMMYQFLNAAREDENRIDELKRTLAVDDTADLGPALELTGEELSEETEN